MPLVTSKKMLLSAQRGGYAIGAFNAENMEMVIAIIRAAEESDAPVIIQTTPKTIGYGGVNLYAALVKSAAYRAKVPVCLHLDHGNSFALAVQCVVAGYSSVMIDGSEYTFEKNAAISKKVAMFAAAAGIPTEAELGRVGGKEDNIAGNGDIYTDPEEAQQFVQSTGIASLAVGIGTAHGLYKGVPVLDVERLRRIRKKVTVPLVLHGASGLSDEQIKECVDGGICKVNFATELRCVYSHMLQKYFQKDPEVIDPKRYGIQAIEGVKELVASRIKVCGCHGKAIDSI